MSQALAAALPGTTAAAPVYSAQPPQFTQAPASRHVLVTDANTNMAAPTNDHVLIAAKDNPYGCLVKRAFAIPTSTWSATVLQLFKNVTAPGAAAFGTAAANSKLLFDVLAASAGGTVSTTQATAPFDFPRVEGKPLELGPGEELSAASSVALGTGWVFGVELEFYAAKP